MSAERRQDEWERLNAYVDGELKPDERAQIAARASVDRETAAMVATLARLKAATVEAYAPSEPLSVPRPRRLAGRAAFAAAAAALLLVAIALWRVWPPAATSPGLTAALDEHRAWLGSVLPDAAAPNTVRLERFWLTRSAPRLEEAGLAIARIASVRLPDGGEALSVGYLGSRGCRVTLWIAPPAAAPLADRIRLQGVDVAFWNTAAASYVMLASGMPAERFETIAQAAREATTRDAPPPDRLLLAMREQREQSPPCQG